MDQTEVNELREAVQALQAEVADLRSELGSPDALDHPPTSSADASRVAEPVGRREALRRAGVVAAGALAGGAAIVAVTATPAAAATLVGSGNPGVSGTGVGGSGVVGLASEAAGSGVYGVASGSSTSSIYGFTAATNAVALRGVHNGGGSALALDNSSATKATATVTNGSAGLGLNVASTSGSALAVTGQSTGGNTPVGTARVTSTGSGPAVQVSATGTGVLASGTNAPSQSGVKLAGFETGVTVASPTHLQLDGTSVTPPTTRSTPAFRGAMVTDSTGELWYCVKSGLPGTWRSLAGATSAGSFRVLPSPVRIYDSRTGAPQGPKSRLSGNVARTLDLKVNASTVPAGATAALLTVLLVGAAAGNGTLTLWAAGVARPAANTMVWGPGGGRFTTSAVSALDASAQVQVAASVATDLVIDVVGYYR